jgi:hypothetical protein
LWAATWTWLTTDVRRQTARGLRPEPEPELIAEARTA